MKTLDVLIEDPVIPDQKYSLISIVGPHVKAKCDVWGLKIRGTVSTLEKAKTLTKKLMTIDNSYDIYVAETGKFFPLAVEPYAVGNVEYQNEQLNELIKKHLENKELANQHWLERKNEMMAEAIKEGLNQEELAKKPEHPIAVLQRIKNLEEKNKKLKEDLEYTEIELNNSRNKFEMYTIEEKELANNELTKAIEDVEIPNVQTEMSVDDIRKQLQEELSCPKVESVDETIDKILSKIDKLEKSNIDQELKESKIQELKSLLNKSDLVNEYMNSKFNGTSFDDLFN